MEKIAKKYLNIKKRKDEEEEESMNINSFKTALFTPESEEERMGDTLSLLNDKKVEEFLNF